MIAHHTPPYEKITSVCWLKLIFMVLFTGIAALGGNFDANCSASEDQMSPVSSAAITKKQAVSIAKGHLKQIGAAKNCLLVFPRVKKSEFSENSWRVIFWPSPRIVWRIPFTYSVEIDMDSGEVKSSGWDK